jgi:hypothetical protein
MTPEGARNDRTFVTGRFPNLVIADVGADMPKSTQQTQNDLSEGHLCCGAQLSSMVPIVVNILMLNAWNQTQGTAFDPIGMPISSMTHRRGETYKASCILYEPRRRQSHG